MRYRLSSHRHAVVIDDQVIVLDVERDRYMLLRPPAAKALDALARRIPADSDIGGLSGSGFVDADRFSATTPDIAVPMCSASERGDPQGLDLHFATVAMGVARAMLGLRFWGLSAMLDGVASASRGKSRADRDVLGVAQGFGRHRLRLPLRNICLAESLALHRVLRANGLSASFVIGVRLHPFGAHCWLQAGACVLNDSCDHAAQFAPILIL